MHRGMAEAMLELKRVVPDYKELPDAYQIAALRGMLTGNYKIPHRHEAGGEGLRQGRLAQLSPEVSIIKRREVNKSDAMEVAAVHKRTRERSSEPPNMAMDSSMLQGRRRRCVGA